MKLYDPADGDPYPNAYLGTSVDLALSVESAERALRMLAHTIQSTDPARSKLARQDAQILGALRERWGRP